MSEQTTIERMSPLVTTLPDDKESVDNHYRVIGKSVPRIDGWEKVTGKAVYCTDAVRPGMLFGKILYSDRPHARIVNIDTSRALALEGVRAVVTAADAPTVLYGLYIRDRLIFARERVRHIGEPVAAVAATSERIAALAVKLIRVEYEDLPALFDPEDALKPDASHIHPDVASYSGIYDWIKGGNSCMEAHLQLGDVEQGFAQADYVFEDTYRTAPKYQAYLEPHACLADFDHSGRLTVWSGRQQLSVCHKELATALNVPMTAVRVIPLWLGGGFGGKLKSHLEPIAALLARKSARPVKITLTRDEDFVSTHSPAPFVVRLKTGVKRDGTLVAKHMDVLVDAGAYSDHAVGEGIHAISFAQGTYHIPNCTAHVRVVYTNNPDWGCMRGYGALESQFATESQMDTIAERLGIDPVDLRMQNLCRDGDQKVTGQRLHNVQIRDTMEAALGASGYREKKGRMGANRGIGVANMLLNSGLLFSSAFVRVNEDATVTLITAITDHGTGKLTALCQIVAGVLGVPVDRVGVASQDSDTSPPDTGSIASRTIYDSGNAVRLAAEDVRAQLAGVAAKTLNCRPEDMVVLDGKAYHRERAEESLTFAELVGISMYAGKGPLLGRGSFVASAPYTSLPGPGFGEHPASTFMFGTHVAEVEVDPETGRTTVLNYTACHDVGQVINQAGIEGQVEGGVVQGIGCSLYEQLVVQDGRILNPSFVDYQIPTALDVPPIKTLFVEVPDPTGPFGAKGIGEPPYIPPMPAIANAIADAVGVRVMELPITPERLWRMLTCGANKAMTATVPRAVRGIDCVPPSQHGEED
jgi:CO/xanthine dehydrogenase Mo-binding subunit